MDDTTLVRVLSWIIYLALVALVIAVFYSSTTLYIVGLVFAAGALLVHADRSRRSSSHL